MSSAHFASCEEEFRFHNVDVLVVGGGPTGLGAAIRLSQVSSYSWAIFEDSMHVGGLASTIPTSEGFNFDLGGHVTFSHYSFFDELIALALGSGDEHWSTLPRISYVWISNRFVPYPFQSNLYSLEADEKLRCINGLIDTVLCSRDSQVPPRTFDEWILRYMGEGIANLFMRPYNYKVWAFPATEMQCGWLGERVATVDLKKIISNVVRNKPDEGWGPNAVFRFPRQGGTGGIWEAVASLVPDSNIHLGKRMLRVDFELQIAYFNDGSRVRYKQMINTAPLDSTLEWLGRGDLARKLKYSSTHVIGIGLRGLNPHERKCWMYYPESDCPFYRCTVFSLYAESNCPEQSVLLPTLRRADKTLDYCSIAQPGPYWSLLFEVSESRDHKPVDMSTVVDETIQGAINTMLVTLQDEIVSIFHTRLERGYPTPHLDRDRTVEEGLKLLRAKNVWNRGRFGSWKYEVGNQDHSVMLGVEAVDNILFGTPEVTLNHPNLVNGPTKTTQPEWKPLIRRKEQSN